MRSDIQHRSDAVIDQLTGMLNRNVLTARVQELAQQSAVTGEPIGVILGDIDHFKRVNDTRGHTVGDAVLKVSLTCGASNFARSTPPILSAARSS